MTFNELKYKVFGDEWSFVSKYDDFERGNVPGGLIIYGGQEKRIDQDITLRVVCHGQTAWDNVIDIIPTSPKAKAARISLRRECVPNIPKALFNRSVSTRYGWEIINRLDDDPELIEKLLRIKNTPNVNRFGYLTNESYYEWLEYNQLLDDWLVGLSGPRQESLLTILYDDWRKMPSVEDAKNRDIYYYKIGG